ncbi:hypothetical protein IAD21_03252 [Abditibacteriota bacterium]|nr:hypothetical protein IAD21_03252 [Abditibacteriota bacterium]
MILFPADTLERSEVERDYRLEFEGARAAGFATALFDFDGLRRGEDLDRVLWRVPESLRGEALIYRGWMLAAPDYARLFHGLEARGWKMVNDTKAYRFGHHAPENYAFWQQWMPQTAWTTREEFEHNGFAPIYEVLKAFGSSPVIVKDWVKSQKHRWDEACFIPDASDEDEVRRVVSRFLELQGEYLTGGLVFRRFETLRGDGAGQVFEWRSFWLDGRLLSLTPNLVREDEPDLETVADKARECPSRFFTLDFSQKDTGEWVIIEMGDGGVSGLPSGVNIDGWYRKLAI